MNKRKTTDEAAAALEENHAPVSSDENISPEDDSAEEYYDMTFDELDDSSMPAVMCEDPWVPDFKDAGLDAFEGIIRLLRGKKDATELVHSFRRHISSTYAALYASPLLWQQIGFRYIDALMLGNLRELYRYGLRDLYAKKVNLRRLNLCSGYFSAYFYGLKEERFLFVALNQRGNVIGEILLNIGVDDAALFNIRKMLYYTIQLRPKAVILAHNHPGGTLRPSQEDLDCTMEALFALANANVPLVDHLIVTSKNVVSIRANGFIPESIWLKQYSRTSVLKNWLLEEDPPKRVRKSAQQTNPEAPKVSKPKPKPAKKKKTPSTRIAGIKSAKSSSGKKSSPKQKND